MIKTTPAHLQFWSNRHAELHGIKPDTSSKDQTGSQATTSNTKQETADLPQNTFTDPTKHCCYLCSRQFKSTAEANKHERLSQLHRDNSQKPDLVTKATAKMEKAGHSIALSSTHPPADAATADSPNTANADTTAGGGGGGGLGDYRDRAAERRQAFGTSKKISLPMKKSLPTSSNPTNNNTSKPRSSPPEKPADDDDTPNPSTTTNKGMALLGKMGWSAGEGLGAQGTGRTETIAQDMYVAGVGLGARGGKVGDAVEEAERNTKGGYREFVGRTREKARERYEGL